METYDEEVLKCSFPFLENSDGSLKPKWLQHWLGDEEIFVDITFQSICWMNQRANVPEHASILVEGQKALQYLWHGNQKHFQGTSADDLLEFPCLVSLNEYMEQTLAMENPDRFPAL